MLPTFIAATALLATAVVVLLLRHRRERQRWRRRKKEMKSAHAAALRSLEKERYAILNALSDAFFLVDEGGSVRYANTPARALFSGREILNRPLTDIVLDRRFSNPIRKAIKHHKRVTAEIVLPQQASPLGSEDRRSATVWIVDAGPIDPKNSAKLTRVIVRDATSEHQTEQVRKDFVANASHELRTPLAIINGYLENLIDDNVLEDPETTRRFLKIMQKHGNRIARIVEDMLIISRLESGQAGTLKKKPFRLEGCVQDVLERLESVIVAQKATVKVVAEEPDLGLDGDRFYWTQVLFNLIENALKQNPDRNLQIEVGWGRNPEGDLRMWVSDNGIGIPNADLPFIFRRFYRVEKHHSQAEIKGTGLGLSIVKRGVEAHGGDIEVSSTPGVQTKFEILLPAELGLALEEFEKAAENAQVDRVD